MQKHNEHAETHQLGTQVEQSCTYLSQTGNVSLINTETSHSCTSILPTNVDIFNILVTSDRQTSMMVIDVHRDS